MAICPDTESLPPLADDRAIELAARLVSADRRGKQIFYSIHDAHVAHVIRDMVAHVNEEPE